VRFEEIVTDIVILNLRKSSVFKRQHAAHDTVRIRQGGPPGPRWFGSKDIQGVDGLSVLKHRQPHRHADF